MDKVYVVLIKKFSHKNLKTGELFNGKAGVAFFNCYPTDMQDSK